MTRAWRLVVSLALVLPFTPRTASADEQVFVLTNGRRIQGELEEETASSYIVRTSSGRTTLPRSLVKSIEAPLEQPKAPPPPDKPATHLRPAP